MDAEVIVIGAGLAGLRAARHLEEAGRSVLVIDAADAVGGRVRTDVIDGFRCDHGFQVLNPAYPAVGQFVDLPALELQAFGAGVSVRTSHGLTTLAHPARHPQLAAQTMSSPVVSAKEVLALARWIGPTMVRPQRSSATDQSLNESLNAAGVTGSLRTQVIDTFLAGVLADSSGQTSANFARSLVRYFVLGTPGLPRGGMQALPEQLAAQLGSPVRFQTAARQVSETSDGVQISTDAGVLTARRAVVAVGGHQLDGLVDVPTPQTRGLTTWWFSADELPLPGPFLVLDGRGASGGPAGPVWHTAVVSQAAPSYAPADRHLIEATTLLDRPDGRATEAEVRGHLEQIYQHSTSDWQVLNHHVIEHALPAHPAGQDRAPVWASDGVLVTGDHRTSGSIQDALMAGEVAGAMVADSMAPTR